MTKDRIRVWNEETNVMIAPVTIQEMIRNTHNLALIHGKLLPPESDPYWHLVFMRNTGVFDVDGKEVFSDDLITKSNEPWVYRIIYLPERARWCAISLSRSEAATQPLIKIMRPTIVGNVFENKDMVLKGEIIDG